MADTNPPLPKSGGSAPFVIAAVVMLLLMGGLIYWKLGGSDDDEQKAQKPPPAPTATQATLEDPPPPPPPPVDDDAGQPAPEKQVVKRSGGGGGGCTATCDGGASSQLQAALRAKAGLARGCYERALRQNSMLQGRLRVAVKIGSAGNVCSAGVVSNELGDPGVATCVLQMFRSGSFPAPQKGCVDAEVPLNFQPKT